MTEAAIRYRICPRNPGAHLFEVQCTVADPDPAGQRVGLPAWIPGSYMIRDFARHIVRLRAQSQGAEVGVRRAGKDSWACAPCTGPLTLIYEVYAWDLSVRGAHLDTTHAFFNGTSVFLQVYGRERNPCVVDIDPPDARTDWRVATAMRRTGAEPGGFGTYCADDYGELIDHPVEIGDFSLAAFEACGVLHEVAISGRHRADLDRLCRDLKRICEQHILFFGMPAPMNRYVFLITAVGEGYGGLEHRASASLLCQRDTLAQAGDAGVGDDYRSFLGLASHEYFHAWNVKRIRPQVFSGADLSREVHTRLLWAFEGITSYYDDLALVRSGLITAPAYLELLGETATRVWRGSGRFKQSLADSSFDAWTKFYRQDENAPNSIVSYYTKGALVALALDLTLRRVTGGVRSLDDVMRLLWRRYGQPGVGVPEDGVERAAAEVAGTDLDRFFHSVVHGTDDPPLADLLGDVGIDFVVRPAESENDRGGKPARNADGRKGLRAVLGARLAPGSDARLIHVFDGGAAQEAGLSAGDVIMAADGLRVDSARLEKMLNARTSGSCLHIHAFRRDELMEFDVTLKEAPADTCVLVLRADATADACARRTAWLQGVAPAAGQAAQAIGSG
ncbi:MAG: PDZ domain-containing protein [Gammaproteobacteria bacterium]|nr:PDZ domain-containing protein [Gammaproteobacteria bacterium]